MSVACIYMSYIHMHTSLHIHRVQRVFEILNSIAVKRMTYIKNDWLEDDKLYTWNSPPHSMRWFFVLSSRLLFSASQHEDSSSSRSEQRLLWLRISCCNVSLRSLQNVALHFMAACITNTNNRPGSPNNIPFIIRYFVFTILLQYLFQIHLR